MPDQGLEAGEAEAKASIKAMAAEKAELEGRLSSLEDKLEALEAENANLESMKVRLQPYEVRAGSALPCCLWAREVPSC